MATVVPVVVFDRLFSWCWEFTPTDTGSGGVQEEKVEVEDKKIWENLKNNRIKKALELVSKSVVEYKCYPYAINIGGYFFPITTLSTVLSRVGDKGIKNDIFFSW